MRSRKGAMGRAGALLSAMLLAGGCAMPPPTAPAVPPRASFPDVDPLDAVRARRSLELLSTFLAGTWTTVVQPANQGDSTPMRLRIARLWPERSGEYWFYFEYVDPADDRRLIRQRILRFVLDGNTIRSIMYRLPGDPARYAGEWRQARPFASLDPASLVEAPGCRASWQPQLEAYFAAGTDGTACRGEAPQAVNEHSEFYLGSTSMRSWVEGLDAAGKHVEGPTGPSEFRKNSEKLQ